ncbi:MAG: hypothetical protein ACSLE1_14790 [Sphingobium sp.]
MSSHVAAALVIFAVLQIAVVAKMGGSLLMHFGIFIAIGGFSIAARSLEHRWANMPDWAQGRSRLDKEMRGDLTMLWIASLIAPFLWIPVAIVSNALFG